MTVPLKPAHVCIWEIDQCRQDIQIAHCPSHYPVQRRLPGKAENLKSRKLGRRSWSQVSRFSVSRPRPDTAGPPRRCQPRGHPTPQAPAVSFDKFKTRNMKGISRYIQSNFGNESTTFRSACPDRIASITASDTKKWSPRENPRVRSAFGPGNHTADSDDYKDTPLDNREKNRGLCGSVRRRLGFRFP
jgi:hypothetical protein